MEKKFKKVDDDLVVTIENSSKLNLPIDGQNKEVGSYKQITIQTIPKEHIQELKDYVTAEKEKAEKQVGDIKKELESLKDLVEIPEDIIKGCTKYISKGAKEFKKAMNPLSDAINKINRKQQLSSQIEYIDNQLKEIVSDYDQLQLI